MNYKEARKQFKEMYPHYRKEANTDYYKMQEIWACYIDGLCKDRIITQKQYDNWLSPFQR